METENTGMVKSTIAAMMKRYDDLKQLVIHRTIAMDTDEINFVN